MDLENWSKNWPQFSIYNGYGEEKNCSFTYSQSLSEVLSIAILPNKCVNSGSGLSSKDLKIAIKKKCEDEKSFWGLFCFHMGAVF